MSSVIPFPDASNSYTARGTSEPNFEPNGKFGLVVGDPVVSNVSRIIPGARGYPEQYPASTSVVTGGVQGRRDVVNRLNRQSALCPNQRFALVGYSQGADVMHRAADEIPTSLYPKILAVAMFGDPNIRTSLGDRLPAALEVKLLQSCATRDPVSDIEDLSHLGQWLTAWPDMQQERRLHILSSDLHSPRVDQPCNQFHCQRV